MKEKAVCVSKLAVPWIATLLALLLFFPVAGSAAVTGSVSAKSVPAGDTLKITGTIEPGQDLFITLASQRIFVPKECVGSKERGIFIKEGKKRGFNSDTKVPYLAYIITNNSKPLGKVDVKRYGGAFFFSGLYKTKMFYLAKWDKVSALARKGYLGPIDTKEEYNLYKFNHEKKFGLFTVTKERTMKGKMPIFSRDVLTDYSKEPYYWNKGTKVSLDKATGKYEVSFKTFRHTYPNTPFDVYVNGKKVATYTVAKNGFWLPLGYRYLNPVIVIIGGIIVGWFFSLVGLGGGMLMAAYQVLFLKTSGPVGINAANTLKPSNLPIVFFSPIAALRNYWWKEKRLVLPLALAFGIGIFIGAFIIGPPISAKYLPMAKYKAWLGIVVLVMAIRLTYEMTPRGLRASKSRREVVKKYQEEYKKAKAEGVALKMSKVETVKPGWWTLDFKFFGSTFRSYPILFGLVGVLIGIVAVSFGIGGGFILVPTMTMFAGLPMYLAVPVSLVGTMFSCVSGLSGFMVRGYWPDPWIMLGICVGAYIGGFLGGRTQRFLSEKVLKVIATATLYFLILRFLKIEIWI
ncbi:MAG: sulfite exporter TauE/SafE family protein [Deltaproteobacteria bacterium]|nr:sulfite exporter TauE/SafE family protein [Deltaproteobacteria bacterium]MBW1934859.1 sulfite exporter TauE/SafE family protein [Deltaproteobacteria bacterium]RLB32837.1 MAG: sulfite exporter TauE/SafE family protein [Deltaproteobacteria bacterium]